MGNNKGRKRMRIFLGGTCNGSKWREQLIEKLNIDYFNPVVKNWDEQAKKNEIYQRETCDYVLYTITPKMKGVYSIAEVVDDSNKRPKKTIFCILDKDEDKTFDKQELNSLNEVANMVYRNGGKYFHSLDEVANFVNKK
jgi:hypothetical protein